MNDNLDFSGHFDLSFDRGAAIASAAQKLDQSMAHLAPGAEAGTSEAGDIARAFASDKAELGRPVVYRVDLSKFEAAGPIPVSVAELTRRSCFYCVSFPVSLFAPKGGAFNQLEVKVEFNPDDDGLRPTSYDVLPDSEWATKFKVGADLSVGVTGDLKLKIGAPQELAALAGLPVGVEAGAGAEVESRIVAGPFEYALQVPRVVHTPADHDHVFWRLSGGKFSQHQDAGLRVVLRVPKDRPVLNVNGYMQATRSYKVLGTGFKQALDNLPKRLAAFFREGTPIRASGRWELSEEL